MKIKINKKYKIIGRTRLSAETTLNQDCFTKSDYYRISRKAREFILNNKVDSLPIDLFSLITSNKWVLMTYYEAREKLKINNEEWFRNNWGFTICIRGRYIIFYDSEIPTTMQRFTLAHEIGHIVLKHFFVSNDFTREKEANMFATRLLMPMCVLYESRVSSVKEIEKMCYVSESTARYRYERLQLVKTRNKFYTDHLELLVKQQFINFINKHPVCL